MIGLLVGTVLSVAGASGTRLSAVPSTVARGATTRIDGLGFAAGSTGQLTWDGSATGMPAYGASASGTFSVVVTVPSSAAAGAHTVAARGTAGGSKKPRNLASTTVTVLAPTPAPTPTPTRAPTPTPTQAPTPTPTQAPTATPTHAPTPSPHSGAHAHANPGAGDCPRSWRCRLLRILGRRSDRGAARRQRRHDRHPGRHRLRERIDDRIQQLLRPIVGSVQVAHEASARQPRVRHRRRDRLFRLLRRRRRRPGQGLLRLQPRRLADVLAQLATARTSAAAAPARPRSSGCAPTSPPTRAVRRRVLAPPAIQLRRARLEHGSLRRCSRPSTTPTPIWCSSATTTTTSASRRRRPPASPTATRGIREFVVGTGGRSHYPFPGAFVANSQVHNDGHLWRAQADA